MDGTTGVKDQSPAVFIAGRSVGSGHPCFVIAELGANHNGDVSLALALVRAAHAAGADCVKFQKRNVDVCIPPEQRHVLRETPWGEVMPYIEYRRRLEFGQKEYDAIAAECARLGILWSASVWDEDSVEFLRPYRTPFVKIGSPSLTDDALLRAARTLGVPVILSTGMSTLEQIDHAVEVLRRDDLILLHCRSVYPCPPEALGLRTVDTLRERYRVPAGFSGHETGLWTTLAAAARGAAVVERHFTMNRAMAGTDHAASVEPHGFAKLVQQIRRVESAMGDGRIGVIDAERGPMARLRRIG